MGRPSREESSGSVVMVVSIRKEDMRVFLTVMGFFEGSSVGFTDGEVYEKRVMVRSDGCLQKQ